MDKKIDLRNVLVIDTELSCDNYKSYNNQLIEVGIVVFDVKELRVKEKESLYIFDPLVEISKFCTDLTGITYNTLHSKGKSRKEVKRVLSSKFKIGTRQIVSWGRDDVILKKHLQGIKLSGHHIDLCHLFSMVTNNHRRCNLDLALSKIGEEFEGCRHSGRDDAFNTAKIYKHIISGARKNYMQQK